MRRMISILFACLATYAPAATLPEGFIETPVATGLSGATAMAFSPDGRLFVCEQHGALRVIKNGTLLEAPFVEIPVDSTGERGLLGVAIDPDFATNQWVYVYYTATTPAINSPSPKMRGVIRLCTRSQSGRRDRCPANRVAEAGAGD